MSSVIAYPSRVAVNATSLVIFTGAPNVAVSWALTGSGSLVPAGGTTDASGSAYAVYTPNTVDAVVTITVTHGT